jgi:phage gpG-like protein
VAEEISVKILNGEQVLRSIRMLAEAIGIEKGKPQKIVAIEAIKGIHDGFNRQISPEGVPWRPLKSRSGKTLQDHRILYHSITSQISGPVVTVGTNDKRARMLHYGGKIYPKRGRYLAIALPGTERRGPLRATFRDAFVLNLGGKSYGNDRLWLVQRQDGQSFTGGAKKNSFRVEGHGKLRFLALLVRWVEEPGRAFIGMSLQTQDNIIRRMEELARKSWETGNSADPQS